MKNLLIHASLQLLWLKALNCAMLMPGGTFMEESLQQVTVEQPIQVTMIEFVHGQFRPGYVRFARRSYLLYRWDLPVSAVAGSLGA